MSRVWSVLDLSVITDPEWCPSRVYRSCCLLVCSSLRESFANLPHVYVSVRRLSPLPPLPTIAFSSYRWYPLLAISGRPAEVPYRPGSSLSRLDLRQNMPTKPVMLRALVPLQRSLFSSSIRHDVNDVKWNERCDSTTSGKFARV